MDHSAALTSAAACLAAVLVTSSCVSARRRPADDYGVRACPDHAAEAPLSVDALQCWFAARHGRWRTLGHESHFDVLVVQAEALDLRDAEEIARRFVEHERQEFSEILVYVHPERPSERGRIRRVQWTRDAGFKTFDFEDPSTSGGKN